MGVQSLSQSHTAPGGLLTGARTQVQGSRSSEHTRVCQKPPQRPASLMVQGPPVRPSGHPGPKPGVIVHGLAQPGAPSPALMTHHPSSLVTGPACSWRLWGLARLPVTQACGRKGSGTVLDFARPVALRAWGRGRQRAHQSGLSARQRGADDVGLGCEGSAPLTKRATFTVPGKAALLGAVCVALAFGVPPGPLGTPRLRRGFPGGCSLAVHAEP